MELILIKPCPFLKANEQDLKTLLIKPESILTGCISGILKNQILFCEIANKKTIKRITHGDIEASI